VLFRRRSADEAEPDHDERNRSEREIDEEAPAPGRVVREPAAHRGAEHGRGREDGSGEALPLAAETGRDDVADRGDRQWDEAACAEALDRAAGDQHPHRHRESADDRADGEERDSEQEERPAAVDVRQLSVQRHGDGGAQHVRREDPGVMLESAEIGGDPRQGGGDDRLVEGRKQHAEHEPEEHDQGPALAERIDRAVIHFVT
jgi:hypothetical protein